MDFNQLLHKTVDELAESGKIEQLIQQGVEKCVEGVLSDAFRRHGGFGKMLEEAVEKSFSLNGSLDLPSYNDLLLKVVRKQVSARSNAIIQQQVAESLEELLEPPPEEITLLDLVDKYLEWLSDYDRSSCVCAGDDHEIMLRVTERDYKFSESVFRSIKLSANKSDKHPDYDIGFHNGKVYSFHCSSGSSQDLYAGHLHGFPKLLFDMKVAKTKITGLDNWEDIDLTKRGEVHH